MIRENWHTADVMFAQPFANLECGDEIVDTHYMGWRKSLRLREPYRILGDFSMPGSSDLLIEFCRSQGKMYTNKMLAVIGKDLDNSTLFAMACYDNRTLYFVHVEVKNDANQQLPVSGSDATHNR